LQSCPSQALHFEQWRELICGKDGISPPPDPQEASLIADEASNFLCGSLKIASAIAALLKEAENPNDGSIIFAR
jgi:hypothetical protein